MKEQDKTPEEPSRNRHATWERVEGSDHKQDQRNWENKGCIEWEVGSF